MSRITYKVEGSDSAEIRLTYNNRDGSTTQKNARLGWSKSFDVEPGQFLYLSAQRTDLGAGKVICIIEVDGHEFRRTEKDGEFIMSSCSGRVP